MKPIKSALSSYFILCGIWVVLAFSILMSGVRNPSAKNWEYAATLCGIVALLWACWLNGFRIEISGGWLKYRDGFYRLSKIPVKEIKDVENKWIEYSYLWRRMKVPRLLITALDGKESILINSKPFGRHDLNEIIRAIRI